MNYQSRNILFYSELAQNQTEIPRMIACCPARAGSSWESRMRTSMSVVCQSELLITPASIPEPGVCGLYGLLATPIK